MRGHPRGKQYEPHMTANSLVGVSSQKEVLMEPQDPKVSFYVCISLPVLEQLLHGVEHVGQWRFSVAHHGFLCDGNTLDYF